MDTSVIKSNYSRMSDAQVMQLANNQGDGLTHEAIRLLYEEFNKRGLDTDVFYRITDNAVRRQTELRKQYHDYQSKQVINKMWNQVIELKADGNTDLDIWRYLTEEKHLQEEQATLILWSLEKKVSDLLKTANTEIAASSIASLFLVFLLFNGLLDSPLGCLTILLLIRLGIMFYRAVSKQSQYSKVLKSIASTRQ